MPEKEYIKHPLILENAVEQRLYQLNIASGCTKKNSLVVLPTSLGKTVVALLIMVARLERAGGKVLLLSPTKPLVEQHFSFFSRVLKLSEGQVVAFTGGVSPEKRGDIWNSATVIISTPQVIENDLLSRRINLNDVSCVVFDEAHRTVGDYAYTYIAEKYMETAKNPLVLGITASPGSEDEKISDVCQALSIENVIVKTENDADIKPYVHKKEVEWLMLSLPKEMADIEAALKKVLDDRMQKLSEFGYSLGTKYVAKRDLLALQKSLANEMKSGDVDSNVYAAISVLAEIMKIEHAVELIETQGTKPLLAYLQKLESEASSSSSSKAAKRLVHDLYFRQALHLAQNSDVEHPKFYAVREIVQKQLTEFPESKIIVFTNFRDTANTVLEALSDIPGVSPVRFVGQGSRHKDKGLTQKQQTEILDQFRNGDYNVLIATSVAEEGLDIPATDMVLFYEPIPSEVRSIQRKGRTGRFQTGRVIVLVTKGTRDEAYRWSSQSKERKMLSTMKNLQKSYSEKGDEEETPQRTFSDFEKEFKEKYQNSKTESELDSETDSETEIGSIDIDYNNDDVDGVNDIDNVDDIDSENESSENTNDEFNEQLIHDIESKKESSKSKTTSTSDFFQEESPVLKILVDNREMRSGVRKLLEAEGVELQMAQLEVGDYVISDEMAVERKSVADFSASLLDGKRNLFSQLVDLSRTYKKPALIVEGEENITAGHMINPNSIRGALLSIEMDLNVSIFYTKNEEETALLLKMMAKKEQINGKKSVNPHGKKVSKTTAEQQEYILSSIPGVGPHAAKMLLNEFGSLENVFNSTEEDLCRVKGIGKKTAGRILGVVKADYK
ncbi:ATP-dependent RNA helicase SrmB [Methanosarcinaceae archaeon Ag5]|uniref:ATP-dependent RNA helicase SrmB n=1 Tax=Methanolapillus africanus TaxID=3028297 RepID=A0AAE4MJC1_9EURY|nr:ATP-dependent RNA helicase SrmB [Methanosarcinaceae archaeon Ag5]